MVNKRKQESFWIQNCWLWYRATFQVTHINLPQKLEVRYYEAISICMTRKQLYTHSHRVTNATKAHKYLSMQ